jgi:hypothetical protein
MSIEQMPQQEVFGKELTNNHYSGLENLTGTKRRFMEVMKAVTETAARQ